MAYRVSAHSFEIVQTRHGRGARPLRARLGINNDQKANHDLPMDQLDFQTPSKLISEAVEMRIPFWIWQMVES